MIQTEEVPKIAELSDDFNNLLQKLLAKDPLERPCWQELKDHSWWASEIPLYEFKKADYPD
jgi:serine/threonine protein kinase